MIKGWTEGLQLMVEGEKARFWIPEDLAFQGKPGAPKGTIVYDVELISFQDAPVRKPIKIDPNAADPHGGDGKAGNPHGGGSPH